MMTEGALFPHLPASLEASLRDANPWWRGEALANLPPLRRWAFEPLLHGLTRGLTPATVLRGPRQVGKSTLLAQLVQALIDDGVHPTRIFRVQFDDLPELKEFRSPLLELPRWFSAAVLGKSFNQAALDKQPAYLLLDEVQNLADWAPQLKHLVDMNPVRVLVTGSSALRIEAGRDSLAGRVTTLDLGPLLLREVALLRNLGDVPSYLPPNGLAPLKDKDFWRGLRDQGEEHRLLRAAAFAAFADRGAYPVAQVRADEPWERIADLLNETVIRRAIQHDLRMGPRGAKRDEHLLEEVFRLACRYVGQGPSPTLYLNEIRQAMNANIGWQRVYKYLKFLDGTLLLRLIEPLELRLKRRKGPSKLCLCDHALRAAWLQERIPLTPEALQETPHLADLSGHVAESTLGYFLGSIVNLDVAHFPGRATEPEVDFVITVGEQRIPIEVKYRRRIDHKDTLGLRSFLDTPHYHAPFAVLVTLLDDAASDDPRIVSLPLSSFLLMR